MQRACCCGLGGARAGRRLPAVRERQQVQRAAPPGAAAAAERADAGAAQPLCTQEGVAAPLDPASGDRDGWVGGKPGQCPSDAGEIDGTPAADKGGAQKLGVSSPHRCLGSGWRVPGGAGSPESRPSASTEKGHNISFIRWHLLSVQKYLQLEEAVRILLDFLVLIL